jgi:hypothetical protein
MDKDTIMRDTLLDFPMFDRPRGSIPILVLLFLLPQSVFVIGDYLAVGLRFPLLRAQLVMQSVTLSGGSTETTIAPSIITVVRELQFVVQGIVGSPFGKTAIATYIWVAGLAVLIIAAVLVISWQVLGNPDHARYPGPLLFLGGALFIVWAIVQFGPLFYGPVGYSLPIGIPFLWYCAYQFTEAAKGKGEAGDE